MYFQYILIVCTFSIYLWYGGSVKSEIDKYFPGSNRVTIKVKAINKCILLRKIFIDKNLTLIILINF